MAGISIYSDGDYNPTGVWGSATNDRAAWERTFTQGNDEQQKMAQAMITASPVTSGDEIRAQMSSGPPSAPSYPVKVSPTLDDVLNVGPKPDVMTNSRAGSDFSGTNGGYQGTSQPSLPGY